VSAQIRGVFPVGSTCGPSSVRGVTGSGKQARYFISAKYGGCSGGAGIHVPFWRLEIGVCCETADLSNNRTA